MTAATLRRSAHGLSTPRDDMPWWRLAACIDTAHLHLAEPLPGNTRRSNYRTKQAAAVHLCRVHCPVLAQCAADIADRMPSSLVQAGVVYESGNPQGRPAPSQPQDPGHGPWCQHLRGIGVRHG